MPTTQPQLHLDDVARFAESCFAPGSERVGTEVEFLTAPIGKPLAHADFSIVRDVCDEVTLPGASRITFEPGGQVEVSSATHPDMPAALAAATADVGALEAALGARGIRLVGAGIDQMRPERRVLFAPRYDAMEAFFDVDGLSGRTMMCRTAAIQVNLDFGPTPEIARARWRLAHSAGPVLAASFANSPLWCGAPSGWLSTRAATWSGIDRTRTAPVGGDGPEDWARAMLDARVMLIRRAEDDYVPMLQPMTLRQWVDNGHALGWPTLDDLAYHATTLFPPVRPRGWLEIRMCDALPDPWWQVPVAVWTALVYHATGDAAAATAGCDDLWRDAARAGLGTPVLRDAAVRCFDLAIDALPATGASDRTVDVVRAYAERYVRRARTPADDILDSARTVDVTAQPVREAAWT